LSDTPCYQHLLQPILAQVTKTIN